MPNTYTQIYIQVIFAVKKNRGCFIGKEWKEDLYKYITAIVQNKNHKMLQINGVSDHIHIFIGLNPTQSISELVKDIKTSSNKFINDNKLTLNKFSWQEGYGAFSYHKTVKKTVIQYIENQEKHHQRKTFKQEYKELLEEFNIEYNEKYLFEFHD